jgi:hypothetical protein
MLQEVSENLENALYKRFGDNWQGKGKVPVEIHPVDLFWLVRLMEWGLDARKELFLKEGGGKLDATGIVNMADFQRNLEEFVAQAVQNLNKVQAPTPNTIKGRRAKK